MLYTHNVFSFKGSGGFLAFEKSLPERPCAWLRHVHLSTAFLTPKDTFRDNHGFPPDDYDDWAKAAGALSRLQGLRSLRVEITVFDVWDHFDTTAVDGASLTLILQPLKAIPISDFTIELNMEVPQYVMDAIGPVGFTPLVHSRPHNDKLHPLW